MSKSLGEKLFDAAMKTSRDTAKWSEINTTDQAECEKTALAFAASLSHDETATATIKALLSERESLLAALVELRAAFAPWKGQTVKQEEAMRQATAVISALTTKEV